LAIQSVAAAGSPFGGIPRNWKHPRWDPLKCAVARSPFGGIPRNWKHYMLVAYECDHNVPPSGGSLEIGNVSVDNSVQHS